MPPARPLSTWRFRGTLRDYQEDILGQSFPPDEPLHIVAPPGAGKTLVGLLLAIRDGRRAVALTPTTTIRHQWGATARELATDPDQVSEDTAAPADLTVMTYQALSVVRSDDAVGDLARVQWHDELAEAGRTTESAEAFLNALQEENPREYRSGLRRRHRRLRRELVRSDPSQVAQVLHPNALALVDRLVEAGVETILLDECHHLLDHWALVVGYLRARIAAAGGTPHLIGLTATLPSPDDGTAYDNYTGLLGDVDYEIPTPAVVREGNLAPYRDLVWFTEPTAAEQDFLRRHEEQLTALAHEMMSTEEGVGYLVETLQPEEECPGGDAADRRTTDRGNAGRPSADQRLAAAFRDDMPLAESCSRMLRQISPRHDLIRLLPTVTASPATTEDALVVLGRFAQRRLLADPSRRADWERVRTTLADFGYQLTDRGIRRGRDPVDSVLAHSCAKDAAAVQILRHELSREDGHRMRAVVVCDFAVHGNQRGHRGATAAAGGSDPGNGPAGALRAFATLAADPAIAALRPVLVTAQHLRMRTADVGELMPQLAEHLQVELRAEPLPADPEISVIEAPTASAYKVVRAISAMVSEGQLRVLVGTRGLLGEGWDCPAINTLVDLTAVATSSATQQLRGRTLRLDPQWPGKVAHNWGVACVVPPRLRLDHGGEISRVRRRHQHLWGLSTDDDTAIITGLRHSLTVEQELMLTRLVARDRGASAERLNEVTLTRLPERAQTYRQWRVGEPYTGAERETLELAPSEETAPSFVSPPTLAALVVMGIGLLLALIRLTADTFLRAHVLPNVTQFILGFLALVAVYMALGGWRQVRDLRRSLRRRAWPADSYRAVTLTVAETLHGMHGGAYYDSADVSVRRHVIAAPVTGTLVTSGYDISLQGGSLADQRLVIDAVAEIFGPVERPRFLLRVARGGRRTERRDSAAQRFADRVLPPPQYVPVPGMIARRQENARKFTELWKQHIGPATLVEVRGNDALEILAEARRHSVATAADKPHRRRQWL